MWIKKISHNKISEIWLHQISILYNSKPFNIKIDPESSQNIRDLPNNGTFRGGAYKNLHCYRKDLYYDRYMIYEKTNPF